MSSREDQISIPIMSLFGFLSYSIAQSNTSEGDYNPEANLIQTIQHYIA